MAYTGRVDGGLYIAQKSRNNTAVVWVMQTGGGNKGMIDLAHTKTSEIISWIGQRETRLRQETRRGETTITTPHHPEGRTRRRAPACPLEEDGGG